MANGGAARRTRSRFNVRRLVDLTGNRSSVYVAHTVAAPDRTWEDADHHHTVGDEELVVDPWNAEDMAESGMASGCERRPQEAQRADHGPGAHGIPDGATTSNRFHDATSGGAKSSEHQPQRDPSADNETEELSAEDDPIPLGSGSDEDWSALEEAEDDLVCAAQDLLADLQELSLEDKIDPVTDDTEPTAYPDDDDPPEGATDLLGSDLHDDEPLEELDDTGFDDFTIGDPPNDNLATDLDVFEFDKDAYQPPWKFEPEGEGPAIRRAREKAAAITNLLDVTSPRERDAALIYLTDLFEHLPHPATFRAIENATSEGLDIETLWTMVEVRRVWMRRPEWWVGRYTWGREVGVLRHGASAFTWALARRVCRARWNHPPQMMIDDEWMDEWLALPSGAPGYLSFPVFIDVKVSGQDAELLDAGLRLMARGDSYADLADDFAWYRRVPDTELAIRDGFRIITPNDDRPGRLGGGWRRGDENGDS